jgi:hypothetical protein
VGRARNVVVVGIVLLVARPACKSLDDDRTNFRESVFVCEEALGQLEECCSSFETSKVRCQYYSYEDRGCEGYADVKNERPALDIEESRCILRASCEELVRNNVCARAQAATAERYRYYNPGSGGVSSGSQSKTEVETQPAVCP